MASKIVKTYKKKLPAINRTKEFKKAYKRLEEIDHHINILLMMNSPTTSKH